MLKFAEDWRRSVWTKLIAGCFIGLIALGNIWLVQRFSLDLPPFWLQTCFVVLTGAVFVCGAGLMAERLFLKVLATDEASARRDDDEHTPQI